MQMGVTRAMAAGIAIGIVSFISSLLITFGTLFFLLEQYLAGLFLFALGGGLLVLAEAIEAYRLWTQEDDFPSVDKAWADLWLAAPLSLLLPGLLLAGYLLLWRETIVLVLAAALAVPAAINLFFRLFKILVIEEKLAKKARARPKRVKK